jgi:CelD/BcsL family acetyltransferase involved in cellulose biosynthesis
MNDATMVLPKTASEVPRACSLRRKETDQTAEALEATPIVAVVDTEEGFDALRPAWNDLLARSDGTVFQSFEWLRTWWRHFGEKDRRLRLHIVAIWSGGEIVGIAPLYLQRCQVLGPVSYRTMCFLGREVSDYLDVIARRGRESDVVECLAAHLVEGRELFDLLLLEDMPGTSSTQALLHQRMGEAGLSGNLFVSEHCPQVLLQDTWEATTRRFTTSHRNRLLKRFSTISETYQAQFERVDTAADMDSAMDDFMNIHQERWMNVGHLGVFHDARTAAFHSDVAPLLARHGWAYVAFLTIKGKRVAADYGFTFAGTTGTYLGGSVGEKEFLALAPGHVLRMHLMIDAIGRGDRIFDFMRGGESYKYGFGAIDAYNWELMLFTHPGRSIQWKRRAGVLRRSLVRRIVLEREHLQYHARKDGVLSTGFAGYVAGRVRVIVQDGLQKFRNPERSLVISRGDQKKASS